MNVTAMQKTAIGVLMRWFLLKIIKFWLLRCYCTLGCTPCNLYNFYIIVISSSSWQTSPNSCTYTSTLCICTLQHNHKQPLLCCLYSARANQTWGKKATSLGRNTKQIHVQRFSNTRSSVTENKAFNNRGLTKEKTPPFLIEALP